MTEPIVLRNDVPMLERLLERLPRGLRAMGVEEFRQRFLRPAGPDPVEGEKRISSADEEEIEALFLAA